MDKLFGKYEIERKIGEGAFSGVYLVKDCNINRLLAMKKMKSKEPSLDEVTFLKDLQCPGLPALYDFRKKDDEVYIFMEYVDGISLREYLDKNGKVPLKKAIRWIDETARIIEYLHERKPSLIYSDLKPENIMIDRRECIYIIDLGGAYLRTHNLHEKKNNYGTPGFSAPEIMKGQKAEKSSDIFSIGAVFHEMLTGVNPVKPPFVRHSLRTYDKSIPSGIEYIVDKCLKPQAKERYQVTEDFRKDLSNYKSIKQYRRIIFGAEKMTVVSLYLLSLVLLFYPLIKGIPEADFPFPFIIRPMLIFIFAFVLHRKWLYAGREKIMKIEKKVFLSDKKYSGMLFAVFFALGSLASLLIGSVGSVNAEAKENTEPLWVNVCDENERNILNKSGETYAVSDKVRLEIPCGYLPEDEVSVTVVCEDKRGKKYVSDPFKIMNECQ